MSNIKNIKLTPIKQLIDLNGDKVNFDLTFNATSANKVPFDALVVTQKMLDSETPLEYKKVTEGTINGNIVSDKDGNVKCEFSDHMIKLHGFKSNIIGRAIVIHADCDDNGLGGFDDSLTTGHAGKRIACAVIGYSKEMFVKK